MRMIVLTVTGLLLLAIAGFLAFGPGIAEGRMNRVAGPGRWPVSEEARRLHARLTIVDLHADTLLWQRNLLSLSRRGHVDLPRLQAGGVALQVFSSVTKTPKGQNYDSNTADSDNITLLAIAQLQPPRTWNSLLERSLWHAEKLESAVLQSEGLLWPVRSASDLDGLVDARSNGRLVTGALLSTEGAHNLEGRLANVARLHAAGFRMMGLVHFFDNDVAGSMHGVAKGGLTPFGTKVVAAMEEQGIIVDLAHASRKTFFDVLRIARRPVLVSHGGIKATCDTPRNLDTEQLLALKANGGMIGIGYWDAAVCAPTPQATAKAIAAAIAIMGPDHVGLGSDFDGAVTTGFDTAHLDALTQALLDAGLSESVIEQVMGGNALRLIRQGLIPLAKTPQAPALPEPEPAR
ncbi:microsomal dipeptidase-like Zn-dependent dipeptidase [Polymorphobacter multimanifer]|uniref:Microsomal dipeptidase-like Zn-dependent dipeptidase n=1 Tax=Polymorphobacter multimanifer TaxID=1070431 RepID=A0A841LGC7_9SPHN|nr:dipeptidase [Polymorphobacter multimanifer]MBB6228242.1 microsomal dipeptidase-like Zn-dependent dipeptidase [Polymorphobacter multimanifer]